MPARLSPGQVAAYRRDGYLLYQQPVLPAAEFAALADCFEGLLASLPAGMRPEAMDVPHFQHPELFRWLFAPAVLDLVEPLLGPDLALFSSHFICKPAGHGKRVPWHEDSAYWGDMLAPMEVVTVWLALDPSTEDNGCMYVVPGSHAGGYSDYEPVDPATNVFSSEITPAQRHDSRAVPCVLEPNQASLHDGRLIHGSPANTATQRRCGYTLRYVPASVKLNENRYGYHQLYLARGRDTAGNRYGDPHRAYPELARWHSEHGRRGH